VFQYGQLKARFAYRIIRDSDGGLAVSYRKFPTDPLGYQEESSEDWSDGVSNLVASTSGLTGTFYLLMYGNIDSDPLGPSYRSWVTVPETLL